jgi:putative membrane protein
MKKHPSAFALVPLALAAVLATGCASQNRSAMGAAPTPAPVGAASHFSTADREFATQAAGSGLYEVAASRLAAQRAVDVQVKEYAQMMVTHHSASNDQLMALFKVKNFQPPAGLPADKQAKLTRLQGLSGAEFDREYVRVVGVEDHTAAIALFDRATRETADPDLKRWFAQTLPTLRTHLQAAQVLAGRMAG